MKHLNRIELAVLSIILVTALYIATASPLHLMLLSASHPFIDDYAKSQYLKYAGNDPIGDKITAQNTFAWRHETWNGNDKPYQQARQEIDTALVSGKSAVQLADEYRQQAKANQQSPLAQFRWSYAIWKTITPTTTSDEKQTNGLGAFFALANIISPNTYNYARLRYLLSYQYQGGEQTKMGEKLLQRDPKDIEVKAHLALDYTAEPYSLTAKNKTLQLAKELIQANPKYARNYGILAEAYYTAYYENGYHKQDAVATIIALKKYVNLANPNEDFYESAKRRIAELSQKIDQ